MQEKCPARYLNSTSVSLVPLRRKFTNVHSPYPASTATGGSNTSESSLLSLVYTANMRPVSQLVDLVNEGAALKVSFVHELNALGLAISECQSWSGGLQAKLAEVDAVELPAIIKYMKQTLGNNIASLNLSFLHGIRANVDFKITVASVLSGFNSNPKEFMPRSSDQCAVDGFSAKSWSTLIASTIATVDALQAESANVGVLTDAVLGVATYRTTLWWVEQIVKLISSSENTLWGDASM